MNFVLATIPVRSEPTHFPPVGATSLLNVLIKAGYTPKFYDIAALRPSFEKVIEFFRKEKPDILGISAVVSTAYYYTKKLSHAVKQISPHTKIILGGCLAASAEILLRKCPIDVCVIGEGEKILMNLIRHWERFHDFDSRGEDLHKIKGITFIDSKGDSIFTGYEEQLLPRELPQPDYDLLSAHSDINRYIIEPTARFSHDARFYEPHRRDQKYGYVMTGKGCAFRCTFCHRWTKGYRSYPVDNIIDTMRYMKEKHNVGFFSFGDESFGTDRRMLEEFTEKVRALDVLFIIGAIRISTVYTNPDIVGRLKEAGCAAMIFGMESGSDKILKIMEKGVTRKQNSEVIKLLLEQGMYTLHQLVVGMPGESDETIKETIECIKEATENTDTYPVISTNYLQALPGTPAYEFMRLCGLIGKTLDDEELYLLKVSNVDAGSREHYINVSEECLSKVFLWPHRIRMEVTINWYKCLKWKHTRTARLHNSLDKRDTSSGKSLIFLWDWLTSKRFYFRVVSVLGKQYWAIMHFLIRIRIYGLVKAFLFTAGIEKEEDRRQFIIGEPKSLRKIITYPNAKDLSISERNMLPLRMGR